jgi:hypothetical protein
LEGIHEHELARMDEFSFLFLFLQIAENEDLEGIHEHELARIAEYMRVRPQEIKNEIFKLRCVLFFFLSFFFSFL